MPFNYHFCFRVVFLLIVNKIDVAPYFDFDLEKLKENVALRNPKAVVIPFSAKTGEGLDAWIEWLSRKVAEWKSSQ